VSGASRLLHVANGHATTMLIEAAGIPGACSIWADPLHDGPVPGELSDTALLDVRARFLSGDGDAPANPANDLRRWRQAIAQHDAYDELVLWYEHDLFDQLNLIQVASWIRERVPRERTVSLVCIGTFPGRPDFRGLGELEPADIPPLFERREPVGEAQYALAARAWSAFRGATPIALDELRSSDMSALPFLGPALTRFLEEYPWTTDGLSRTERRLLHLAGAGPIELRVAFPRMHQGERAYYITDTSLVELADALAATTPPLLTVSRERPYSFAITDAGRAVLEGRLDRVDCGLDRWLGGVHLRRGADPWRWDGARGAMTRYAPPVH
jgi:hypothetical protein